MASLVQIVCAAAVLAAANPFQEGPLAVVTLEVTSSDMVRDIAAFDAAARGAGFAVVLRNDRLADEVDTSKRQYENPSRCCMWMVLERRTAAPVLSLLVYDAAAPTRSLRPEECAMYARFRASLIAAIDAARITRDVNLRCS